MFVEVKNLSHFSLLIIYSKIHLFIHKLILVKFISLFTIRLKITVFFLIPILFQHQKVSILYLFFRDFVEILEKVFRGIFLLKKFLYFKKDLRDVFLPNHISSFKINSQNYFCIFRFLVFLSHLNNKLQCFD